MLKHLRREITQFFDIYKDLEPGRGTDVRVWQGRAAAEQVIAGAVVRARTQEDPAGHGYPQHTPDRMQS